MYKSSSSHRLLRLWAICFFAAFLTRCACTNGEPPPPPGECGGSCAEGEVCVADQCLPATCANSACNASEACLPFMEALALGGAREVRCLAAPALTLNLQIQVF